MANTWEYAILQPQEERLRLVVDTMEYPQRTQVIHALENCSDDQHV